MRATSSARRRRAVRWSLYAVLAWAAASPSLAANAAETHSGVAAVADGDTLRIAGARIRLHGIDAPESAQTCRADGRAWPCGRDAAQALRRRVAGRVVDCEERDRDRYGRIVAVCRVAGADVNAWLAGRGWALAYRRYSADYVAEEAAARAARRGIWRGDFVAPWDWRRGERLRNAAAGSTAGCRIKGNVNRRGDRIYHVPGGASYGATRIDVSRGERWFCSEAEARAAGWRRARR